MSNPRPVKYRDMLMLDVLADEEGVGVVFSALNEDRLQPGPVFIRWSEALPILKEMDTSSNGSGTTSYQARLLVSPNNRETAGHGNR